MNASILPFTAKPGEPRMSDPRWYVAIAKPGRTVRALDEIASLGICLVCPMERYHERRLGRRYTVEKPAYGTYILVSVDNFDDLHHINRLFDIQTIMRDEYGFRSFPDAFVDVVLEIDASGALDRTSGARQPFERGQNVRITQEGGFLGLVGKISKSKGRQRWQVVLDACRIPVTMEDGELEPISEGRAA